MVQALIGDDDISWGSNFDNYGGFTSKSRQVKTQMQFQGFFCDFDGVCGDFGDFFKQFCQFVVVRDLAMHF